jgi:DNA-binding NtrC family response regulator
MPARICRVLVVEDDPDIQEMLENTFSDEGYRFAMASDGAEMRRIVADGDVDICVIDVTLPRGESGVALAGEVAAQGIGVILVSGNSDHSSVATASGHRFLAKPFRLRLLLDLVDETLTETKATCERKQEAAAH